MDANFHGPDIRRMLGLKPEVASNLDKQFIPMPYSENLKVASIDSLMLDIDETGNRGKLLKISDIRRLIFFRKEQISVFGWIENMRGFLCQNCGNRLELFSTGSGNRAVFLLDIPFLGRIPIDPHFVECDDAGGPFLEKYPESEVVEACNLIVNKIMGGERKW